MAKKLPPKRGKRKARSVVSERDELEEFLERHFGPEDEFSRGLRQRLASDHERENLQVLFADTVKSESELSGMVDTLARRCKNIDTFQGRFGARRGFAGRAPSRLAKVECILFALAMGLVDDDAAIEALFGAARPLVKEHETLAKLTGIEFRDATSLGSGLAGLVGELQEQGVSGLAAAQPIADWRGWRTCPFPTLRGLHWGHRLQAPKTRPKTPPRPKDPRQGYDPGWSDKDWDHTVTGWCEANFNTLDEPAHLARGLLRALGIPEKTAANAVRSTKRAHKKKR